jgi:predicted GNAT family acetyltransferase
MLSFLQYIAEAKTLFPQEPTGAHHEGPLNLKVKEPHNGIYKAFHKGKLVGAASTWNDLSHGKFSIYKSETHPDYRKKGVMQHIYHHIEKTTGKQLHPSSTLSDDGHKLWQKFRPDAVKNDLRNHRDKLIGKETVHPKYGPGKIERVGSGNVTSKMPSGMNYTLSKDHEEVKKHLA